jgi:carbonic anhydrase
MRASPPPAALAVLALALTLLAGTAGAAEHGAPAPRAKALAQAAVTAASAASGPPAAAAVPVDSAASTAAASSKVLVAGPARAHAPRDPMDRLRERLALKLGAGAVAESPNPNVVRVVSKASAPAGAVAAADAHEAGHDASHAAPRASRTPRRPSDVSAHAAAATNAAGPAAAAALRAAPHAAPHAVHWDYTGSGAPEAWARLNPEFAKCSSGTRQSPIDIREGIRVELDPVQFDYRPSRFRVVDNGHTVQVNVGAGNSIEVMGRRYELVQFHFHRPSEERIEGRQFEMVVHLVHKDLDGRLAVVAVLLDRGPAQPVVQAVWNNLPLEKGDEVAARGLLDVAELLPAQRSYFTYMGSLTTPPCSEGVLWMVMKQPQPVSAEQIGIFARLYPMNARPIQSAGGRLIKESN